MIDNIDHNKKITSLSILFTREWIIQSSMLIDWWMREDMSNVYVFFLDDDFLISLTLFYKVYHFMSVFYAFSRFVIDSQVLTFAL